MIVVFGSINLDIATRVPRLPKPGETVMGDQYQLAPGGKGANQALAARTAGARVRLVGAVGRDAFAEPALELLREGQVDLTAVRRSTSAPTGLATIAFDEKGENTIVVAPGANAEMSADDIPEDYIDRWSMLLVQLELRPSEVTAAIQRAKGVGMRVILNLAPAARLSESVLDAVDTLILNEHEARVVGQGFALQGARPRDIAGQLAERRHAPVIVSAGADGAYVATSRVAVRHIAAPKVNVVDTTGAGDAMIGAIAAGLDLGMPLPEAVRRGVAAGALACGTIGAQTALPNQADIDALAATIVLT